MLIVLLRHSLTSYNEDHRYQGRRDIPLSPAGRALLRPADFSPEAVYVSPLARARETASILFPASRLIPVEDLQEVSFGVFEGRTYEEMARAARAGQTFPAGCAGRFPAWWTRRWSGVRSA